MHWYNCASPARSRCTTAAALFHTLQLGEPETMPPEPCQGFPQIGRGRKRLSDDWLSAEPKCRHAKTRAASRMGDYPLCHECCRSAVKHWQQLRPWLEQHRGPLSEPFVAYMDRKAGLKVCELAPRCLTVCLNT